MQCWKQQANLGPDFGGVQELSLARLPDGGDTVFVTLKTTKQLLGVSTKELKALMDEINPSMRGVRQLDDDAMQTALARGLVDSDDGRNNSRILVTVNLMARLAQRARGAGAPIEAIRHLALSKPPPSALVLPSGNEQVNYLFPASLPMTVLTKHQMKERYGFQQDNTPKYLKRHIELFQNWATDAYNFTRDGLYAQPVQSETMDKNVDCMRAFAGFVHTYCRLHSNEITLEAYWNPMHVAAFVAYLQARGGYKGHVLKHVSLAKKINHFLVATSTRPGSQEHGDKMAKWLSTLETQLNAAMRHAPKADLPQADKVFQWVLALQQSAVRVKSRGGCETFPLGL